MALDAIIFDVDGTLAETEETHRTAFNQAFAEAGFPWIWTIELYKRLLLVTGGKERIAYFLRDVVGDRDLASDSTTIAALHRRKTGIYVQDIAHGACKLRPGIQDLIRSAHDRGVRLAIATTTSLENVESLLAATLGSNWRTFFPTVVAGDMVPRKKPAPDVYIAAMEALGLTSDRCIAIEDSRNGLLAATSAGLATIVTLSCYTSVDDFSEASRVVAGLPDLVHAETPMLALLDARHGEAVLAAVERIHAADRRGLL